MRQAHVSATIFSIFVGLSNFALAETLVLTKNANCASVMTPDGNQASDKTWKAYEDLFSKVMVASFYVPKEGIKTDIAALLAKRSLIDHTVPASAWDKDPRDDIHRIRPRTFFEEYFTHSEIIAREFFHLIKNFSNYLVENNSNVENLSLDLTQAETDLAEDDNGWWLFQNFSKYTFKVKMKTGEVISLNDPRFRSDFKEFLKVYMGPNGFGRGFYEVSELRAEAFVNEFMSHSKDGYLMYDGFAKRTASHQALGHTIQLALMTKILDQGQIGFTKEFLTAAHQSTAGLLYMLDNTMPEGTRFSYIHDFMPMTRQLLPTE